MINIIQPSILQPAKSVRKKRRRDEHRKREGGGKGQMKEMWESSERETDKLKFNVGGKT